MKKQILMLSAAAMFMIASCSKSKEEPKEETIDCQLTQASVTGGGETITQVYEYNSGKITNVKSTSVINNGTPHSYPIYSFNYTSTSISGGDYNLTYSLDAQGRIKSETGSDSGGSYTNTYTYNSEGYLTEVRNDNRNQVTKYTWTNGNLTQIEETTNNGGTPYISTDIYEYGTEVRPANFYSDVPDLPIVYTYIFKYMGKQTRNLVAKQNNDTSFSYGIDNNGNVNSLIEKENGTGKVWSAYEFKYNCK